MFMFYAFVWVLTSPNSGAVLFTLLKAWKVFSSEKTTCFTNASSSYHLDSVSYANLWSTGLSSTVKGFTRSILQASKPQSYARSIVHSRLRNAQFMTRKGEWICGDRVEMFMNDFKPICVYCQNTASFLPNTDPVLIKRSCHTATQCRSGVTCPISCLKSLRTVTGNLTDASQKATPRFSHNTHNLPPQC
jgi:hypothetical protein